MSYADNQRIVLLSYPVKEDAVKMFEFFMNPGMQYQQSSLKVEYHREIKKKKPESVRRPLAQVSLSSAPFVLGNQEDPNKFMPLIPELDQEIFFTKGGKEMEYQNEQDGQGLAKVDSEIPLSEPVDPQMYEFFPELKPGGFNDGLAQIIAEQKNSQTKKTVQQPQLSVSQSFPVQNKGVQFMPYFSNPMGMAPDQQQFFPMMQSTPDPYGQKSKLQAKQPINNAGKKLEKGQLQVAPQVIYQNQIPFVDPMSVSQPLPKQSGGKKKMPDNQQGYYNPNFGMQPQMYPPIYQYYPQMQVPGNQPFYPPKAVPGGQQLSGQQSQSNMGQSTIPW